MVKSVKFEERTSETLDKIADAMKEISSTNRLIADSQRQLNDNFLLHQNTSEQVCSEIKGMRQDFKEWFYPMFKWLIIVAVAAASGIGLASVLGL